jgi:hypothetical protein
VDGKLPAGVALDGVTGVLSGAPAAEGAFPFTVEVRDGKGDRYQQSITLYVHKLVVKTFHLPQAMPNQEFRFKVEVSGGAPPYVFNDLLSVPFPIPNLPPMAQISQDGEIVFTPKYEDGMTIFEVVDSKGEKQMAMIRIQTRKLFIQGSAFLPPATAGERFQFRFAAAAQRGNVVWEADAETLAQIGLALNGETGELSGTPLEKGVYSFEVTARDENRSMGRQFTLTVEGRPN